MHQVAWTKWKESSSRMTGKICHQHKHAHICNMQQCTTWIFRARMKRYFRNTFVRLEAANVKWPVAFVIVFVYGAPNGPKIRYLSWLHFIWLFDFTRHKYCLSSVNTGTKLGRWHKTWSMKQNSVDDTKTQLMAQFSVYGTKLGRWHKTRSIAQNSDDDTKLDRWHKTPSMTQNLLDDTKLGRWHKTRSMTQNSVDDTKLNSIECKRLIASIKDRRDAIMPYFCKTLLPYKENWILNFWLLSRLWHALCSNTGRHSLIWKTIGSAKNTLKQDRRSPVYSGRFEYICWISLYSPHFCIHFSFLSYSWAPNPVHWYTIWNYWNFRFEFVMRYTSQHMSMIAISSLDFLWLSYVHEMRYFKSRSTWARRV